MAYPPQPGMMPPRPRYAPNGAQVPIPIPGHYGPAPPMPYGAMPGYPRGAAPPRPPGARGPGSPTIPSAPMPRTNGPAQANGAPRPAGLPAAVPQHRPLPAGAPPPAARPAQQQNYKLNPQVRNAPAAPAPAVPEAPALTTAALANATPMEQKQMLGEVIYMKIAPSQPELAGKITGMLLEMDNSELLHLLESPDAMNGKVNEALTVLHEFAKDE